MFLFKLGADGCSDAGHLLLRQGEFGGAEVHVGTFVHGHEVHMGVGNVEAYDRYTYFTAWDCLFDCFRYPFCKEHQGGVFLVGEVEDVVDLFLGITRTWPGCTGFMSRKAKWRSSSATLYEGISPAAIRENIDGMVGLSREF